MPWYSASRSAFRSSTTSIAAAGDLGEPSSSLNVRSFSFRCFMMMAVVVVAAEFDVVEECVVVVVVLAALVPLPLATCAAAACPWELLLLLLVPACPASVRSSFIARLASSVSVAVVVVVGDSVVPLVPDPVPPDSGEVGEVVELGDFSGIGMSRSIDFWLTALCVSVARLSQICLVGSISIIETMVWAAACRLLLPSRAVLAATVMKRMTMVDKTA